MQADEIEDDRCNLSEVVRWDAHCLRIPRLLAGRPPSFWIRRGSARASVHQTRARGDDYRGFESLTRSHTFSCNDGISVHSSSETQASSFSRSVNTKQALACMQLLLEHFLEPRQRNPSPHTPHPVACWEVAEASACIYSHSRASAARAMAFRFRREGDFIKHRVHMERGDLRCSDCGASFHQHRKQDLHLGASLLFAEHQAWVYLHGSRHESSDK